MKIFPVKSLHVLEFSNYTNKALNELSQYLWWKKLLRSLRAYDLGYSSKNLSTLSENSYLNISTLVLYVIL
jgi:hypothetical protein